LRGAAGRWQILWLQGGVASWNSKDLVYRCTYRLYCKGSEDSSMVVVGVMVGGIVQEMKAPRKWHHARIT